MSLVVLVVLAGLVAGILLLGSHGLWRGSSRTLFSLQERRQLVNLARSALAEAHFTVQSTLDSGQPDWFLWLTGEPARSVRTVVPVVTQENRQYLSSDPTLVEYQCSSVQVERVQELQSADPDVVAVGLVDFKVTTEVTRRRPRHHSRLTLVERRHFWIASRMTEEGYLEDHLEVSRAPIATEVAEE